MNWHNFTLFGILLVIGCLPVYLIAGLVDINSDLELNLPVDSIVIPSIIVIINNGLFSLGWFLIMIVLFKEPSALDFYERGSQSHDSVKESK